MAPEDLALIKQAISETRAKPEPWTWLALLKLGVSLLAIVGGLWVGASYLFVTGSRAAEIHARMKIEQTAELNEVITAIQAINQIDAVQTTKIEAHEKRLDSISRGRR